MIDTVTIDPKNLAGDMSKLGRLIRYLAGFGKILTIKISDKSETRRDKQNRLLWRWHGELANHIKEHVGEIHDTEDIHDHVAGKLLPKRVSTFNGEPEIKRTQTSKLKVKPFADFLTTYEMWANDVYSCIFSQPDDLYWSAVMKDLEKK